MTIKELAEALNISKVSVYKLVKRNELKNHVFKRDNVTVIDETGVNIIKAHYSRERDEALEGVFNQSFNQPVNQLKDDLTALLQEQLREKDNQINSLLTIVKNTQTMQAAQYLVDGQAQEAPTPKKSFWDWFKK